MSNYTLAVPWSGKDALSDSDAAKVISGSDFNTEFTAVQTAVNTKADTNGSASESFSATTATAGTNTTQVATTAFVTTATSGVATTENTFTKTQIWTKGSDVASATALTIGDGNYFDVTGTTTVTSIATVGIGVTIKLHFDGAVLLTHSATDLVLPGGANVTTAAGDEFEFTEYATGDWRVTGYALASGASIAGSGKVVQIKNYQTGAFASTTTTVPTGDVIQQITEGAEFMTLAFTPTSATNRLMIEIVINTTHTDTNNIGIGLFVGTTADAIASVSNYQTANHPTAAGFNHNMVAGVTSALTFRVRAGGNNSGRTDFNGDYGVRRRGGRMASSITITEYEV